MSITLDVTTFEQLKVDMARHEYSAAHITLVETWIARGDQVLVYENRDLGHIAVGQHIYVSYGGERAQIERTQFPEPPVKLPDVGGLIGWRYQLVGVVPSGS
jgi:hypothetical protein